MAGVTFHTFGCKANQYDSERMRQALDGHHPGHPLHVVNTCTVTNQADAEARSLVRRLAREDPGARIVVAGCSAALRADDYARLPGVVGVVRGHDPEEVARAAGARPRSAPSALIGIGTLRSLSGIDLEPVAATLLQRREGGRRGWLKVQDGCDRKCAFCATRLARGASRSRPPAEVIAEARLLARHHPELVVTGIHIGHYGHDPASGGRPRGGRPDPAHPPMRGSGEAPSLSRLMAGLLEACPGTRFRLGSIEATEVDDLLLDLLADSGGMLAPHLHMPLQSGADPVLRRMRRWHTREQYRRRALDIAGRIAPLGLGADLITGFPGETDADHQETVRLVEELPFTYLHVFPFSPRDGTAAAELARRNPVPQRLAAERARELRELGMAKGEAYLASRIGARVQVVVERERPDGTALGLTEDYLRLPVEGERGGEDPRLHPGVLRRAGGRTVVELLPDPLPIPVFPRKGVG